MKKYESMAPGEQEYYFERAKEAIANLPALERQILTRVVIEDKSIAYTAVELGITYYRVWEILSETQEKMPLEGIKSIFLHEMNIDNNEEREDDNQNFLEPGRQGRLVVPEKKPPPKKPGSSPVDQRPAFLDALLATVPKDTSYEDQAQQREELRHSFNQKFAASHGEALKAEMLRRGKTAKTPDDKLELARWANGEIRRFGLAFSTAKTGLGILTADKAVLEGRFIVKGKAKDEDDKTPYFHTKDITELVETIAVVEAPPRREALSERIEREADVPKRNRRR
jgi:hypothetical protein